MEGPGLLRAVLVQVLLELLADTCMWLKRVGGEAIGLALARRVLLGCLQVIEFFLQDHQILQIELLCGFLCPRPLLQMAGGSRITLGYSLMREGRRFLIP